MKESQGIRENDWWLLALVFTICALGVMEIYSATHSSSQFAGMHTKQLRWILIGTVLMFALSRFDYHKILDQAPTLYLVGIVALIAVLAVGNRRFSAKRWIALFGQFLQVSELVKLVIIVGLARFLSEVRTDRLSLADLLKAGVLCVEPLCLILLQPYLGTALGRLSM